MEDKKQPLEYIVDLINRLIEERINLYRSLDSLDGKGSPYSSEESIRGTICQQHMNRIIGYANEINRKLEEYIDRKIKKYLNEINK